MAYPVKTEGYTNPIMSVINCYHYAPIGIKKKREGKKKEVASAQLFLSENTVKKKAHLKTLPGNLWEENRKGN